MSRERTLVTLQELSNWMTKRLQEFEDCEGSTVTVRYRLQTPDAYGANWSENVFFEVGPKTTRDVVLRHVGNLVREAREMFNVRD